MFKKNELRAEMVRKGLTAESLAKKLGINEVTLWRKMNGESDFYRNEILGIAKVLSLNDKSMCNIFFAH